MRTCRKMIILDYPTPYLMRCHVKTYELKDHMYQRFIVWFANQGPIDFESALMLITQMQIWPRHTILILLRKKNYLPSISNTVKVTLADSG